MARTAAHFEIAFEQCIGADGKPAGALPEFARDPEALIALYRGLVRTRVFDAKAVALQRTGRLGTYASSLGEEAVAVGAAAAMRPEDVLVPSFREHGAQLWRGVTPLELFLYWGGDERGSDFAGPRQDFPVSIPVGSHAPHAAGVALAFKLRRAPRVAVCIFGDGATSKGDVAEALNIAAVWRLPAVFLVANNQWAISVPRAAQSVAETLAQKAIAAGMRCVQLDGNDVVAVRAVVGAEIERARAGQGPALVEALTYRLSDHTTSDDASRYRSDEEVTRAWQKEPMLRLRRHLADTGPWTKAQEQALLQEVATDIDSAAAAYLATPPQDPASIFDYTFAELPADLRRQRAAMRAAGAVPAAAA